MNLIGFNYKYKKKKNKIKRLLKDKYSLNFIQIIRF
jgi:hypothetical protein